MAVSYKTLLVLGVLAVLISLNEARRITKVKRRSLNDTETKRYGGYGSSEFSGRPNQYNCQGYYDCMGQMEGKSKELASLKAEQSTLLATMTSVNKKALEQERILNKLVPQNKRLKYELEELNAANEEAQGKVVGYVNQIADLQEGISKLQKVIDEILGMCRRMTPDELITGDYGYYYIYDGANDYTWWEAHNLCRQKGMHLVTIETEGEDDDIYDMIIDQWENNQGDALFYWIGLNNYETTDEDYQWIGTGLGTTSGTSDNTFEYENWNGGGPSASYATNNCVGMFSPDSDYIYWYDMDCYSMTSKFICELPPVCYHLHEVETRMLRHKKP